MPTSEQTSTQTPATEEAPAQTPENYIQIRGAMVVGGDGEPIQLINNPAATNPTYAELLAFLEKDPTDKYSYIFGPPKAAYICGDFAEDVHNNAEAAGIKAAWVGIDIYGEDEGHAINAYETTDIGLVYVDSTGKGLWDELPSNWNSMDKRARVMKGEEYAVTDVDRARNTTARFLFSCLPQSKDKNGEWVTDWRYTRNSGEYGLEWIKEWLREHRAELSRCSQILEPEPWYNTNRITTGWRVMVDCMDVPWFQAQEEVVVVDGIPLLMKVEFEIWWSKWFKPLGTVEDIHIQW
ncbi:hypothetical protein ACFLYV_02095 [Chloroflexota bacterium]